MNKPILNIDEVELQPRPPQFAPKGQAAERYDSRMGLVGTRLGAQKLGYNITSVPPGKRAFPRHNHRVNEEMFFVLQGSGEVRIGSQTYPIRQGDFIACPPGGKESAHQIVNTGKDELKFLAVSTKIAPEICDYPDSGKFGVWGEFPAKGDEPPQVIRHVGREGQGLDYWEGE